MHATAGRRRRRAEIELAVGSRVEPPCWTDEELPEVGDPAVDVAPDVIGVVPLDVGRAHDVTREDARSESWGESFDLRLDPLAHVDGRSIRDMTGGPADMLAGRCACRIGHCGLSEDHERPLRNAARGDRVLGRDDLVERAADMDGAGLPARRRAPGDGAIESPVDLEHARAIPKSLQLPIEA